LYCYVTGNLVNAIDIMGKGTYIPYWGGGGQIISDSSPTWREDMHKHFDNIARELRKRLEDMCQKNNVIVKGDKNTTLCYTPEQCKKDAAAFASAYVNAVEEVYMADYNHNSFVIGGLWGDIMGGMFHWDGVFIGTDRQWPEDAAAGNGLVCGGWVALGNNIFVKTLQYTIYKVDHVIHDGWIDHTWINISTSQGTISLDPWPSGGWDIFR
jgi:hypothetical protein